MARLRRNDPDCAGVIVPASLHRSGANGRMVGMCSECGREFAVRPDGTRRPHLPAGYHRGNWIGRDNEQQVSRAADAATDERSRRLIATLRTLDRR